MSTEEKEYSIVIKEHVYLELSGVDTEVYTHIPVSKEEFDEYYRPINAYRRKEQYHNRCFCPENKWLLCNMDCLTCRYHKYGDTVSYDTKNDDDENSQAAEVLLANTASESDNTSEDKIIESEYLKGVLAKLNEVMPDAITIGQFRMAGFSDTDIQEFINQKRTTFNSRIKAAKKVLEKEFPDLF